MSDILAEYAKIAARHGLVKEAQSSPEQNGYVRYDSNDLDAIGLLYGVKPNGKEDDETMIEKAHPETYVAARSYDAMNSVVENDQQRQDMMAHIARKMPNPAQTQHRYIAASNNLLQTLVAAGEMMDAKGDEELTKLADACAKRLTKKAFDPVVGGIVTSLAVIYYFGYAATSTKSVAENAQYVLEALDTLSDKPYYSSLQSAIANIQEQALRFYEGRDEFIARSMDDIVTRVKDPRMQKVSQQMMGYYKQLKDLYISIPKIVKNIELAHAEDEARETIFGKVTWEPHEILIDRLYGQGNWLTSGRTGGLYNAVAVEMKTLQAATSVARSNAPALAKTLKEEATDVAEDIPDSLTFGIPGDRPSPASSVAPKPAQKGPAQQGPAQKSNVSLFPGLAPEGPAMPKAASRIMTLEDFNRVFGENK